MKDVTKTLSNKQVSMLEQLNKLEGIRGQPMLSYEELRRNKDYIQLHQRGFIKQVWIISPDGEKYLNENCI